VMVSGMIKKLGLKPIDEKTMVSFFSATNEK